MLNKIKNLLPAILSRAKLFPITISSSKGSMKLIATLYIVFSFSILLAYAVLFGIEYANGETRSADLLPFIDILIGSSMIAFITFILGLCIDTDGDGVPDTIDNTTEEDLKNE